MIKNNPPTAEMSFKNLPFDQLAEAEQYLIAGINAHNPTPSLSAEKMMYAASFQFELSIGAGIARILDETLELEDVNNVAITAVGSTGRLDGSGIEEVELAVFFNSPTQRGDLDLEQVRSICARLATIPLNIPIGNSQFIALGLASVEEKHLNTVESICTHSVTRKAYPGRVIEGMLVFGNGDVLASAKSRAFAEIADNKKISDDAKEQQKNFRKAMESGIYRMKVNNINTDVVQVDLEGNKVLFAPDAKQFGLKYGVIRYAQTRIAQQYYNLVRNGRITEQQFIELPQSIEERLRYAVRCGWATDIRACVEIMNAYMIAVGVQNSLKLRHDQTQLPVSCNLNFQAAFRAGIQALANDVIT